MFQKRGRRRCRPRRQIIVLGQTTKKAGGFCLSAVARFREREYSISQIQAVVKLLFQSTHCRLWHT